LSSQGAYISPLNQPETPLNSLPPYLIRANASPPSTIIVAMTLAFSAIVSAISPRIVWMALRMFSRMVARLGGVDMAILPNAYIHRKLKNIMVLSMAKKKRKDRFVAQKTEGMSELEFRLKGSIEKLKKMGINPKFYHPSPDIAYLFIPLKDVAKLIDGKIEYGNHRTYLEGEYLIIEVWR